MDTKEDLKNRAWSVAALEHSQMSDADAASIHDAAIKTLEEALELAKAHPNNAIACSVILGVKHDGCIEMSGGLVGSLAATGAVDIVHNSNMEAPRLQLMEMSYDLIGNFRARPDTSDIAGVVRRLMGKDEPCDCDGCIANRAAEAKQNIKH